jgi:hypothetical protein
MSGFRIRIVHFVQRKLPKIGSEYLICLLCAAAGADDLVAKGHRYRAAIGYRADLD